jgi:hypothetical protein
MCKSKGVDLPTLNLPDNYQEFRSWIGDNHAVDDIQVPALIYTGLHWNQVSNSKSVYK